MKIRKISSNTRLELVAAEFVHISQKIHPKGHYDRYLKINRDEAKLLVRYLFDWLLN